MTSKSNQLFKCKYCNKGYKKESTLVVHQCEKKRRWNQENDIGVRIGLQAWLRFYELTQSSTAKKSYSDFVDSQFYKAFVKFGWHAHKIRAVNLAGYIDFLIKEKKKLDWWAKDRFYEEFLYQYIRKEHPNAALERSIDEINRWAEETNGDFSTFFITGNKNKVCQMIGFGRVSPWVLFNCTAGVEFLSTLNSEQVNSIYRWIDPSYWDKKFKDNPSDTKFAKSVLEAAGFND